jgi:hypothetical protein
MPEMGFSLGLRHEDSCTHVERRRSGGLKEEVVSFLMLGDGT